MSILVTTPTGKVGSRILRLLVQAGERPTAFLRDAGRLDPRLAGLVDVVEGDQHNVDDVVRATEGTEALYWVSPPVMDGDPVRAHELAGENVARAVVEHAIERTVFQSSVGAEHRTGVGEIDGLARTEELLDATGRSVTHLRCGYFFTNLLLDPGSLAEGILRTPFHLDAPMPWVDPRDIGDVGAARLLSRAWSGRHVQAVHGPADLTFEQVAEILGRVTGRPFRAERIADEDLRQALLGAGMGAAFADAMVGMAAGLRDATPADPRNALTTTPTTLASWAQEHLGQR